MVSEELIIERCTEFKVLEARRYEESCHIYCILNKHLKSENIGSIISIEKEPKRVSDEKKVEIDALIQIGDNDFSMIELKTSVRDGEDIEKTLRQLEERDDDLKIDNNIFKINHLILISHLDDIEKIKEKYDELISKKEIKISRPVVFLSWTQRIDKGDTENYYIEYQYGDCSNNAFLEDIKSRGKLKKGVIQTIMKADQEKYLFSNKRPCSQYLYVKFKSYIHQRIFPILTKPTIEETVNLLSIDEEFKFFLDQMGNELVKPRIRWFKDSIKFFKEQLGWITINDRNQIEISLDKFKSHRRGTNDEFKFFSKKLCQKQKVELKKKEKALEKIEEKYGKGQQDLSGFFKK